jgi:hypothetical protein
MIIVVDHGTRAHVGEKFPQYGAFFPAVNDMYTVNAGFCGTERKGKCLHSLTVRIAVAFKHTLGFLRGETGYTAICL